MTKKNLNLHLVVLGSELIEAVLFKIYYITLFQNLNVLMLTSLRPHKYQSCRYFLQEI